MLDSCLIFSTGSGSQCAIYSPNKRQRSATNVTSLSATTLDAVRKCVQKNQRRHCARQRYPCLIFSLADCDRCENFLCQLTSAKTANTVLLANVLVPTTDYVQKKNQSRYCKIILHTLPDFRVFVAMAGPALLKSRRLDLIVPPTHRTSHPLTTEPMFPQSGVQNKCHAHIHLEFLTSGSKWVKASQVTSSTYCGHDMFACPVY